jgi:hypothetical protein
VNLNLINGDIQIVCSLQNLSCLDSAMKFHLGVNCDHGRMQDFSQGKQISDCNSLSGLNPLTNRVLNKKIII